MDTQTGEPDWELMASSEWSPTEEMLEKAKGFSTEAALEADDRAVVQEWKDIESKCEKTHEVRPWPSEGSFGLLYFYPTVHRMTLRRPPSTSSWRWRMRRTASSRRPWALTKCPHPGSSTGQKARPTALPTRGERSRGPARLFCRRVL